MAFAPPRAAPRRNTFAHALASFLLAWMCPFIGARGSFAQNSSVSQAATKQKDAQAAAARGDWPEAATLYADAVKLAPRDAKLRIQLGSALAKAQRYTDAISNYQEALKLSPHNSAAEVGLAQACRSVNNFDEARRILERAVREHPHDAAPLAVLGDTELEMQTYDIAIKHFLAALTLDAGNTDTRNRLASAYRSKGDAASALAQIAKVLARDPQNALAYYLGGEIEADHNDDAAALRDAEKVLELQPQNRPGRILLAKVLVRAPADADPDTITARCQCAADTLEPLRGEGQESETLFLLSRAYQCAGESDKAKEALDAFEAASQRDRAAAEGEKQAMHLVQEANERAMKNDLRGALDLLQQALEKNPNDGTAYSQLAKLYYSTGDVGRASEAIAKALSLDPYQPDFHYVQGKILEKQGKLEEALSEFGQTAVLNPKESDAYYEMGGIYERLRDRPRALAAYKRAVELSPDDPDYRRALAALNGNSASR